MSIALQRGKLRAPRDRFKNNRTRKSKTQIDRVAEPGGPCCSDAGRPRGCPLALRCSVFLTLDYILFPFLSAIACCKRRATDRAGLLAVLPSWARLVTGRETRLKIAWISSKGYCLVQGFISAWQTVLPASPPTLPSEVVVLCLRDVNCR